MEFYKRIRLRISEDDESVLRIKLESLIYDYEETVEQIESFTGFHNHISPQESFVPDKSMANTQLYKVFPQYESDVKYIEKNLSEYLFPFETKNKKRKWKNIF